jgi:flagellar protein FliL
MSAATAVDAAPPPKGKKKLIIIVAAVLAVVLAGGGAAVMMMKSKAAAETEEGADDAAPAKKSAARRDPKTTAPVFVPLDPFTVNLADRNADRYAQVAVTLEVDDPTLEAQLKTDMPAVRNNILLAIADRTAGDLLARDGKQQLAQRIMRETSRALGYDVPDEEEFAEDGSDDEDAAPKKKKRRRAPEPDLPIRAVHFANFIIQ